MAGTAERDKAGGREVDVASSGTIGNSFPQGDRELNVQLDPEVVTIRLKRGGRTLGRWWWGRPTAGSLAVAPRELELRFGRRVPAVGGMFSDRVCVGAESLSPGLLVVADGSVLGTKSGTKTSPKFTEDAVSRHREAPRVGLEPTTLRLTAGCSAN